jgi:hypothetical protein
MCSAVEWRLKIASAAKQVAEKVLWFVNLSEAKNPSLFKTKDKEGFLAQNRRSE